MLKSKNLVFLGMWICLIQSAFGQCFELDNLKDTMIGCAPLTVTITNCSSQTPIYYNYNYGKFPNSFEAGLTHTYNTPGTYLVVQRVQGNPNTITSNPKTVIILTKHAPAFTVDFCANKQIRLSITDTLYDTFLVNYGDGTAPVTVAKGDYIYTYFDLITKTVSVQGFYDIGCSGPVTTKSVTPILSLTKPDVIDMAVSVQASSGAVSIRFGGLENNYYQVLRKIGAAPFFAIDTMLGTSTGINVASMPNAQNTLSNVMTYRLHHIDMCGNASAPSADIHNIIISVTPTNGLNTVNWQSSGSFASTELNRNLNVISSAATSPYADSYISCNLLACYRTVGVYSTSSLTTGSPIKTYSFSPCVTSILITTLPALTINSGYVDGKVVAKWSSPVNSSVDEFRLTSIGANADVLKLSDVTTSYSTFNEGNCYTIEYGDDCNNESYVSAQTCPMRLSLVKTNEIVDLTWTPYEGYETTGLGSYAVEILNEDGSVRSSTNMGTSLSYSETLNPAFSYFQYRVKAISNGSENMVSYSNTQVVDLTPQLYMPTVFTPNGDGVNDVFVPKGKYLKSVKLTVFNKWGEVIFATDDAIAGWDGTYRGEPVSLDTYSYYVQAEATSGESIAKRGVVSVLR